MFRRLLLASFVASLTNGVSADVQRYLRAGHPHDCTDLFDNFATDSMDLSACEDLGFSPLTALTNDGATNCMLTCAAGYHGYNADSSFYQSSIEISCPGATVEPTSPSDESWECQQFACNTTALDAVTGADLSGCNAAAEGGQCSVGCAAGFAAAPGPFVVSGRVAYTCTDGELVADGGTDIVCAASVNCAGAWSTCAADCGDQTYTISTPKSGQGLPCEAADGTTAACSIGDGDCNPCENGGTVNGAVCDCFSATGFEGEFCEVGKPACGVDEYVLNGGCQTCSPGTSNDAGDEPTGGNTECSIAFPECSTTLENATCTITVITAVVTTDVMPLATFLANDIEAEICGNAANHFGAASDPYACIVQGVDEGGGDVTYTAYVEFEEGAVDIEAHASATQRSLGWGNFPADSFRFYGIPLDQLTDGPISDFIADVATFDKEGKIDGGGGDCEGHGKGNKGKKGQKCPKKEKKSKKSKGDKGPKSPKESKKKKGKKGGLNNLAAKMAVKRTSQVVVALLGSMLVVAAVAGYNKGKKSTGLTDEEKQVLLPAANPEDVALDLHLTYVLP